MGPEILRTLLLAHPAEVLTGFESVLARYLPRRQLAHCRNGVTIEEAVDNGVSVYSRREDIPGP